jgi:excisionase family DNA binding protein
MDEPDRPDYEPDSRDDPDLYDDFPHRLLYSLNEAAEILSLSRSTLKRLVYSGELNSIKVRNALRIPYPELLKLARGR